MENQSYPSINLTSILFSFSWMHEWREYVILPYANSPQSICNSQFAICADWPYDKGVRTRRTRARLGLVSPAGLG